MDTSDPDHVVINIRKSLARLNCENIEDTGGREIIFQFPTVLGRGLNKTVRVLKVPKNPTSIRKVYLSQTARMLLRELKEAQTTDKTAYGDDYHDYNLVFAQHNGDPLEDEYMSRHFKLFVKEHDLHMIDFYALRHSGATAKLRGTRNLKAVQGDMGHATPEMLTKVYAAIVDEDRVHNADVIEESVLAKIQQKTQNMDDKYSR